MRDLNTMPQNDPITEEKAWFIALGDHPELAKIIEEEGDLPEEMVDEEGNVWNPQIHLTLHCTLECQIARDEPAGIAAIAEQLTACNLSRHDVRHAMADPLATQLSQMMNEQQRFDQTQYLKELHEVVQEHLS